MDPYKTIIACTNQKGGCAKTTTAVNLATSLAEGNPKLGIPPSKVLLIDLDPQGNASTSFGVDKRLDVPTVYELLMQPTGEDLNIHDFLIGPEILSDEMQRSFKNMNQDQRVPKRLKVENLYLLPSNIRLSGAEIELATKLGRETRLREALAPVMDDFDHIIIDTPPSLGLLTINALAAANWILVPVQAEYYALEGMSQLMNSIRLIQRRVNNHLKLFGIAVTMYTPRSKLSQFVESEVRKHFGEDVFQTVIPRLMSIAEAPKDGAPVVLLKNPTKGNKGSKQYWALAKESHLRIMKRRAEFGINPESVLRRESIQQGDPEHIWDDIGN